MEAFRERAAAGTPVLMYHGLIRDDDLGSHRQHVRLKDFKDQPDFKLAPGLEDSKPANDRPLSWAEVLELETALQPLSAFIQDWRDLAGIHFVFPV